MAEPTASGPGEPEAGRAGDIPPGCQMAREIAEQPDVLARLLDDGRRDVREIGLVLARRGVRFVLLAARGTSDHAALYAKYLVEIRLGLPCGLASPSTATSYGARPGLDDVLLITVSQSGGSPDLVEFTTVARACGATTLAVTNDPGSALAAAAELHLDVRAGAEQAIAATKTYSAELLALFLVVDAWAAASTNGHVGQRATPKGGVSDLPAAAQLLVDRRAEVRDLAQRYRFASRLVVTGRGYSYPTAREAALKLMETSYLAAHAFSGADLMHGPLAMIDPRYPVLAVVPAGPSAAAMTPVLRRVRELGADVLVFSDIATPVAAGVPNRPDLPGIRVFDLPTGLCEELHPVIDIVPLQWLALEIALARGLDPDSPRGLAKVTRTW
jgi:glutamine---fructose-6-phosphate transaminase (isomerizing)